MERLTSRMLLLCVCFLTAGPAFGQSNPEDENGKDAQTEATHGDSLALVSEIWTALPEYSSALILFSRASGQPTGMLEQVQIILEF